jgi:hypothetical protein
LGRPKMFGHNYSHTTFKHRRRENCETLACIQTPLPLNVFSKNDFHLNCNFSQGLYKYPYVRFLEVHEAIVL